MPVFISTLQLSLEGAKLLAAAAEDEATKNGWKIAVAVVDSGGHPIYLARMDGALLASYQGALMKATTAVVFARETMLMEESVKQGRIQYLAFPNTLPVSGGVPLMIDGQIIGGVGVGGTNSARESSQCSDAAVDAFYLFNSGGK